MMVRCKRLKGMRIRHGKSYFPTIKICRISETDLDNDYTAIMPVDIPGYKEVCINSQMFLVPESLVDDVKRLEMTQEMREKVGAGTDISPV